LINKGISANIQSLLHEFRARDACDGGRAAVPREPAADAAIPDTTDLTIDAAVAFVLERYRRTAGRPERRHREQREVRRASFAKGRFARANSRRVRNANINQPAAG